MTRASFFPKNMCYVHLFLQKTIEGTYRHKKRPLARSFFMGIGIEISEWSG